MCMSRQDFKPILDIKNLQLYKTVDFEYIKDILSFEYKNVNYSDKTECKYDAKDKSCRKIKKRLILSFDKYNIQYNFFSRSIAYGLISNECFNYLSSFLSFNLTYYTTIKLKNLVPISLIYI